MAGSTLLASARHIQRSSRVSEAPLCHLPYNNLSPEVPMKIAIIVTEFPSTTETFIMRDVVKFLDWGHDVRLYHLLPYNRRATLHDFAKQVVPRARGIRFFDGRVLRETLSVAVRRAPTLLRILGDLLRHGWKDPEIIVKSFGIVPKSLVIARELQAWDAEHVHGEFAGHPTTCAWIVHRMTAIPYSASCRAHDIFIRQTLLGLTLWEAAAVRCISRYNIDFLRRHVPKLRTKPMQVIHSSIDLSTIQVSDREPKAVFSILYVGSLTPRKGVDDLLNALAQLPQGLTWTLTLIGDGQERQALEHLTAVLRISDSIRFAGPQRFEQVALAYRDCDVLVAPSRFGRAGRTEGIPNVVIEALGHQRPVITTRISGIPELVEDGVTGLLVEPNDPQSLCRALQRVYNDPAAADAMAKRGRARVESEFDLDKNARAQVAMFEAANRRALGNAHIRPDVRSRA